MNSPHIDHYDDMARMAQRLDTVEQQRSCMHSAFLDAVRDAAAAGYRQAMLDVYNMTSVRDEDGTWHQTRSIPAQGIRDLARSKGVELWGDDE